VSVESRDPTFCVYPGMSSGLVIAALDAEMHPCPSVTMQLGRNRLEAISYVWAHSY